MCWDLGHGWFLTKEPKVERIVSLSTGGILYDLKRFPVREGFGPRKTSSVLQFCESTDGCHWFTFTESLSECRTYQTCETLDRNHPDSVSGERSCLPMSPSTATPTAFTTSTTTTTPSLPPPSTSATTSATTPATSPPALKQSAVDPPAQGKTLR